MVGYDKVAYSNLAREFNREIGRVEPYKSRRSLTQDLKLRKEYKECLIRTYNNLVNFFNAALRTANLEDRIGIQTLVVDHLAKLKEAFQFLRLTYEFPKVIYDPIDITKVTQDWSDLEGTSNDDDDDDDVQSNSSSSLDKPVDIDTTKSNAQSEAETKQTEIAHSSTSTIDKSAETNNSNSIEENNSTNMAQSVDEFMALAGRTMNTKYNGDFLGLDSFIDAIKLLNTFCKPENKETCINFIMTKLEGDAREAIETEPKTTQDIIDALREHIKPESSRVIEGRILALTADRTNLTTFPQRAEDLAEQYRRSLCNEGYSKPKAKELAIEKTVDLCRRSARNDQVKAIIAATAFTEPKDVIAKMIVEINNIKLDKSVTYKHNNFHNKNSNKSYKSNNGNKYNKQQNNGHNSGSSNHQNGSNGRQNNGNGNGYRGNRGNYNNSNNGNSNSRTFQNSNYGNRGRQNEQTLRYFSGNETNPSSSGQTSDNNQ